MSKDVQISKSNRIVEARYKLTLVEQKFILMMVSLINPNDIDFKYYNIKIKEVADFIGLSTKNAYRELKKIIIRLNKKTLIIQKDDNRELITSWVASAEYFKHEGIIEFEFSEKLKPYLLQLKKEFTSFKISYIIQLKSTYSIRIYELLKQYEKIGKRRFALDDLRKMLGITEKEYPLFANFNQKVIKIAQKELSEKTDISFTVNKVKNGKKVVGIIFYINRIKRNEDRNIVDTINSEKITQIVNSKVEKIFEKLKSKTNSIALSRNTLLELSTKEWAYLNLDVKSEVIATGINFETYINEKYKYIVSQLDKKKIENPVGLLLNAVKNNYGGLDTFIKKKKQLETEMKKEKISAVENKVEGIKAQKNEAMEELAFGIIENDPNLLSNIMEKLRKKNKIFFKKFSIGTDPFRIYSESLIIRANVNYEIEKMNEDKFKQCTEEFNIKITKLEKQIKEIIKSYE